MTTLSLRTPGLLAGGISVLLNIGCGSSPEDPLFGATTTSTHSTQDGGITTTGEGGGSPSTTTSTLSGTGGAGGEPLGGHAPGGGDTGHGGAGGETATGGAGGQGGQGGQGGSPVVCAAGTADCDLNPANGCETKTDTDTSNCGACGTVCSFENADSTCKSGSCSIGTCKDGFGDCDQNPANGCETDTTKDTSNCGACSKACPALPGATNACVNSTCTPTCLPDYLDCNGSWADSCEVQKTTDPKNCGACGVLCDATNGTATCQKGACSITCKLGYADCTAAPGCETNTTNDALNCGSCGHACNFPGGVSACMLGSCTLKSCNAGLGDCDKNPLNGCEAPLGTMQNCGACGNSCNPATEVCQNMACTSLVCAAGKANCDKNAMNGCETPLGTLQNCGGCGDTCTAHDNQSVMCANGGCVSSCNAGFLDCDGNALNGCETNKNTDAKNCGGCSNVCQTPNATPGCSMGTCSIGSCNPGFVDCDKNAATGCEVNTTNDPKNCGACGHDCLGGACSNGVCQPVTLPGGGSCLAVDDSYVYLGGGPSIWKTPIVGGAPSKVVDVTPLSADDIAIDGTYVYWGASTYTGQTGGIFKAPKIGGAITQLSSETPASSPARIALDTNNVYWLNTTSIWATSKYGGPLKQYVSGLSGLLKLTVDASDIYFVSSNAGTVSRIPVAGGGITTVAAGQTPYAVALDATTVYWANEAGTIMKRPKAGGQPTMLVGGQNGPTEIIVDATSVYWTNISDGSVMRAGLDGQNPTVMATGQTTPRGIAQNAKAIYVVSDKGLIKVAK